MKYFHNLSVEACFKELKTNKNGLSDKEVQKRIEKYGLNKFPEKKAKSRISIFFEQFQSPLIIILIIAGLISLLLRENIDAGIIFTAIFLNTIIGFLQESKANNSLEKLKKMIEHMAIVIREGRELRIKSSELTVGDIIILQSGNRVPADARIIECADLQINEANLSGEALPSEKIKEKIIKGAPLADRKNMVYLSTIIVSGSGQAVVTAIASDTEIGEIAQLVGSIEEEKTPLQVRLAELSKTLSFFIAIISVIIVLIGIIQGRDFFEMFLTGVAVAVAAIPEGLMVAVTVILVLGMQRILRQKALTRKLIAAETLGSITVICSDKTGTLTEGKMQVAHIIIGKKEFEIENIGSRQKFEDAKLASLALQTAMMCNDALVENPEDELASWRIIGSPTESALLRAAIESGLNRNKLSNIETRIDSLPFTSENKFMITLHKKKNGFVLYEKGAPEKLIQNSTHFYHKGKLIKLSNQERLDLINTYENITAKGLRVIGTAYREFKELEIDNNKNDLEKLNKNLIFIGFIALKDPLRKEAKQTIKICCEAGIRPIIITGDHKLTAKAIANELGLRIKPKNIITGEEMDRIGDEKLFKLVKIIDIYARVSPHHKLRIIKALQKRGEVVAMTGDGINDSPALKAADIGVALGSGTDIAKETSDLVLLDNNFKTIVEAIKEGRIIFSNIRKVIAYAITDCFMAVVLIVGSILLAAPLAILPTQILWINIINDGLPNISLAFEKGDKNIMKKKPISKKEPLLNKQLKAIIFGAGMIRNFLLFGVFLFMLKMNLEIDYIRTFIFAAMGTGSLMYIFSLRSLSGPIWKINPFSNNYLNAAVIISFSLLLVAIYWPPLQTVFSTVAIGLDTWLLVVLLGFVGVLVIEIFKKLFREQIF